MEKGKLGLVDPSSYSNPDVIALKHIDLYLDVNFVSSVLTGYTILTCSVHKPNPQVLILDVKDLNIKEITSLDSNENLNFSISKPYKTFGSALAINLPANLNDGSEIKIKITYSTSPSASGLQWLTPQQTFGKKEPYMFSQFQAIHARSVYPCQDTPAVKFTYSAEITAPTNLTVLMSGLHVGEPKPVENNKKLSKFNQPVKIPSYLVAFAVGLISKKAIGNRCSVWAEPELVEAAAYEFSEAEHMLDVAIDLAGDYAWGVCDLLVMPPSFPFGGMENPCIIFVTPTTLAGDRSLADVVAHEISHSWSGNLITTKTFEHFWLNEGFTMFMERKINEKLHGTSFRYFHADLGLKSLKDTVENVFGKDDPYTKLVPDLTDADPDDAFSTVPYEKGHSFLFYLETLLGGPAAFNPFLKAYFNNFKNQSITTDDFKTFLLEFFKGNPALSQIEWDKWLYSTGMPVVIPNYTNELTQTCSTLAKSWQEVPVSKNLIDVKTLSSNQVSYFLELLLDGGELSADTVRRMTELYDLESTKNSEIRFRWLRLGLRAKCLEFVPKALEFINEQGRMKFVRPIYRDLYEWEEVRQQAIANYEKNKGSMMFVLSNQLLKDLHIEV